MRGTVKQFKDMLEEMRAIYDYDDSETILSTHNILTLGHDRLEIETVDKETGITIVMAKGVSDDSNRVNK